MTKVDLYSDSYFNERINPSHFRLSLWKNLTEYLQDKYFPREVKSVLDLGCGTCLFINNVKNVIRYGVDLSPLSKKYFKGFELKIGSVTELSYPLVDVVFSSNLLEHLTKEEIKIVLQKIRLKEDGRLILLLPNFKKCYKRFYDEATHITPLTLLSMKELLEANGFELVACEEDFLPYSLNDNSLLNLIPIWSHDWLCKTYFNNDFRLGGQMLLIARRK